MGRHLVDELAAKIENYAKGNGKMAQSFAGGKVIPDFRLDAHLADVFELVHGSPKVHAALKQIFGQGMGVERGQYRFLSHNDIGVNVKSVWHKDRLSGVYRGYETQSPWDDGTDGNMRVVKVGV